MGSVSMEYDEGGRVVKECFSGGLPGDEGYNGREYL